MHEIERYGATISKHYCWSIGKTRISQNDWELRVWPKTQDRDEIKRLGLKTIIRIGPQVPSLFEQVFCQECDGAGGHGEEYGGLKGTLPTMCGYCDGKGII